jgi:hypothetical protein
LTAEWACPKSVALLRGGVLTGAEMGPLAAETRLGSGASGRDQLRQGRRVAPEELANLMEAVRRGTL